MGKAPEEFSSPLIFSHILSFGGFRKGCAPTSPARPFPLRFPSGRTDGLRASTTRHPRGGGGLKSLVPTPFEGSLHVTAPRGTPRRWCTTTLDSGSGAGMTGWGRGPSISLRANGRAPVLDRLRTNGPPGPAVYICFMRFGGRGRAGRRRRGLPGRGGWPRGGGLPADVRRRAGLCQ